MPVNVKTPVYEGPLDLLLELIEERKLLISDISLAAVTDEYITRLNAMQELPVDETTEFISLAATLLLIKSRSLLPSLILSEDESHDIKELEYRLAVYQLVKDAARTLGGRGMPAFAEGSAPEFEPLFIFDKGITLAALRAAAQTLIDGFPSSLALPNVEAKKIISIEEMVQKLSSRISSAFRLSFSEFSGLKGAVDAGAKYDIIVSFLALLELVKQGIIKANQGEHFSDIVLEPDSVSTPTYE